MEQNINTAVLQAAYAAWTGCAGMRGKRLRNKRFTYGDQWGDVTFDHQGRAVTDGERYGAASGSLPLTNNLIRQLVKTIVGRYRSQVADTTKRDKAMEAIARSNELDELDSRALEEFLIGGCCIQRVDRDATGRVTVDNVNPNRFFVNAMTDPRGRDCEIVGQLHDLSIASLLQRVACGSRRKAQWVRRLYTDGAAERVASLATGIGADTQSATAFWHPTSPGKCRAIEVWTLESREVTVCHNRRTAQLTVETPSQARSHRGDPDVKTRWDIATYWHCRWFTPMGDLLAEWDSPYGHGGHPFAMKFYPLTDGEVHSFVEGVIDQQKHINRMITMLDQIMASCAKGVLLYPETALPDGFTWSDVRRVWSTTGGILPYSPQLSDARPEQISANATNVGAYEMVQLQMRLLEEVSGVSGALQGKNMVSGNSASLYQAQADNANVAMADIYDTFGAFCRSRDSLATRSLSQPTPE